jgi:hypothetical protein
MICLPLVERPACFGYLFDPGFRVVDAGDDVAPTEIELLLERPVGELFAQMVDRLAICFRFFTLAIMRPKTFESASISGSDGSGRSPGRSGSSAVSVVREKCKQFAQFKFSITAVASQSDGDSSRRSQPVRHVKV